MKTIKLKTTVGTPLACYRKNEEYIVTDELALDLIKAGHAVELLPEVPETKPVKAKEAKPEVKKEESADVPVKDKK